MFPVDYVTYEQELPDLIDEWVEIFGTRLNTYKEAEFKGLWTSIGFSLRGRRETATGRESFDRGREWRRARFACQGG